MKVIWGVEDGYAGKSRPHTTEIPDEELEGLSDEQREEHIQESVQEDFNDKVYPSEIRREES